MESESEIQVDGEILRAWIRKDSRGKKTENIFMGNIDGRGEIIGGN